MARVLLLLPTTTYRNRDFLTAASKLGVDVVVASEQPSTMEECHPEGLLTLDFKDPDAAAIQAKAFHAKHPLDGVVPVDDDTAVVAAAIAEALSFPHNSRESAEAARDKSRMRRLLDAGGVRVPSFRSVSLDAPAPKGIRYPAVVKPLFLSASRGVIRVNDEADLGAALSRVAAILNEPDVKARGGPLARQALVEDFVPGQEVALEGLLRAGSLKVLALFDKPDPLEGPFFEETIYVTPSRLAAAIQEEVAETASSAARALGLREGPVHAELRVNAEGVSVIEMAARSIGGLCARTLRFGAGLSLEELILEHALGHGVEDVVREERPAGVMMIPIPGAGILEEVRGEKEARAVPGIEDVVITAHRGKTLVPLPEGSSYLGFLFARGETAEAVERSLREAHANLEFVIRRLP